MPKPPVTGTPTLNLYIDSIGYSMKLKISYHADTDTLWLGNGLPAPVGDDVAENVTVFFDMEETQPNAVMIEHAAELLLSILQAAVKTPEAAVDEPAKPTKASSQR